MGAVKCRKQNEYFDRGTHIEVFDENGKSFLISHQDMAIVKTRYWKVQDRKYVHSYGSTGWESLHRFLMKPQGGLEVDHANRDKTDCRRENMRVCTRSENMYNTTCNSNNTSGYKGVDFHSCKGRWRARIRVNGRRIDIGHFDSAEEAHIAYKRAAKRFHGELACV